MRSFGVLSKGQSRDFITVKNFFVENIKTILVPLLSIERDAKESGK
jgi:hypothetical protein